jgi:hypothetical protein
MVHDVEELSPKLKMDVIGKVEALVDRLVPIDNAGAKQRIARGIAKPERTMSLP